MQIIKQLKTLETLVYLAKSDDKNFVILKLYKESRRALLRKLQQNNLFLTFLNERKKIETPRFLSIAKKIENWEGENRFKAVLTYIDGEHIQKITPALAYKMGEKTALLHKANFDFDKKLKIHHINIALIKKIEKLILKNASLNDLERKNFFDKSLNLQQSMYRLTESNPNYYGLIHSDLHKDNWLLKDEILIPIDFDELTYGHYLTELAVIFHEFEDEEKSAILKENFLKGYQRNMPLPHQFQTLMSNFQYISHFLYLNWFYAADNEDVRNDEKKSGFAKAVLKELIASYSF